MKLIVAVYDNWGIGQEGSQPIALSADRKFFRRTTSGAAVIVGRKTLCDFPGGKPLPGRRNVVLTRGDAQVPGAEMCRSPGEAAAMTAGQDVFVIGGASVYGQMLPLCDTAYVTKVHVSPECDVFFPNLDENPDWELREVLEQGEESGISYEICLYMRKKSR